MCPFGRSYDAVRLRFACSGAHTACVPMQRIVPTAVACVLLFAAPHMAHAAAGDLDPSWGGTGGNTPGTITTDVVTNDDRGYGVAIQADGKIVVAGTADGKIAVTRYNPD